MIIFAARLADSAVCKKDVGVCSHLISSSGLGVPTRKISNAASPRQMNIQHSHVEHGAWINTENGRPHCRFFFWYRKPPSLMIEDKRQVTSLPICIAHPTLRASQAFADLEIISKYFHRHQKKVYLCRTEAQMI